MAEEKEGQQQAVRRSGTGYTGEIALGIYAAAAVAVLLLGILAMKLSAGGVVVIVAIEIGLALCLRRLPFWAHLVVALSQILVGALSGNVLFLICGAALYFYGIIALYLFFADMKRRKRRQEAAARS